jgi:hypothetical protein
MSDNKKDPFWAAFDLSFKITKSIGTAVAGAIKKGIDRVNYDRCINEALSLKEPTRTQVVLSILSSWKRNPEFEFTDQLIYAVSKISEPHRRRELINLMTLCTSKKMHWAVKKIRDLL